MPGIRLIDVRAALAALGLAGLAALAVAITTHLPVPAASGPATRASSAGLSRLQSLPLQAQSVISSTLGSNTAGFAARRVAGGWQLSGGGVRADFRARRAGDAAPPAARCRCRWPAPGLTSVTTHGSRVTLQRSGCASGTPPARSASSRASRSRTVRRRATTQRVTLALTVDGSLRAQAAGSAVNFVGSHGAIAARYGGLTAFDADRHRVLPSALRVKDGRVLIAVNDRGARYPITIDPLVQQGGKLVLNDPSAVAGNQFGASAALSEDGNTALIGAQATTPTRARSWVVHPLGWSLEPAGLEDRPDRRESAATASSARASRCRRTAPRH